MSKRRADVTVVIEGPSWSCGDKGCYDFEATVDGKLGQLRVPEAVAFDFLGGWTRNRALCLHALRAHRSELAEKLAFKLRRAGQAAVDGLYSLTQRDMERDKPRARSRPATAPVLEPAPGPYNVL